MQVKQGLRLGCPAHKIMFDSPCKSSSEIEFALLAGEFVTEFENADSWC